PRKSARLLAHVHGESLIPRKFREVATASPPTSRQVQSSRLKQFYSIRRQPLMTPGVTGLRNLGNTCYMNSILQVLSHLQKFRECFLTLDLCETEELLAKTVNGRARMPGKLANGAAAANEPAKVGSSGTQSSPAGLNGGSSISRSLELIQPKEPSSKHISLCHELHTLFRVMWSGKWALVSPFAMLHSVWSLIPAFRGYDQQDAQEFLCELLDKVQQELESEGTKRRILIPFSQRKLTKQVLKVVNTIFHGQLLSQVWGCFSTGVARSRSQPFPGVIYQVPDEFRNLFLPVAIPLLESKSSPRAAFSLWGMNWILNNLCLGGVGFFFGFFRGGRFDIFLAGKRRKSSPKPLVLSEAKKQLLIYRLPQVLRLHLKRFRGGNPNLLLSPPLGFLMVPSEGKTPNCSSPQTAPLPSFGVPGGILPHLKSLFFPLFFFLPGFWVHCNDSKLNVCSVEEVCKTQAYILFYTQRTVQDKAGIPQHQLGAQVPPKTSDKDRRLTFP
ncbi:UBP49 hydrolase, partial [Chaetorhynchus papuensis]|nr:UBP49 hydrolase [Chaetorhynchus papuensis]